MKILAADKISEKAVEEIKKIAELDTDFEITPDQLLQKIPEYDAVIVRSRTKVTREVIEAGKNLRGIIRAGVGIDNIDKEAADETGIKILNTPEAPTESIAEIVFGLMLSLCRHIPKADSSTKNKEWLKKELTGCELKGKTIGVVGIGRIGTRVIELASAFGMNILAYSRSSHPDVMQKFKGKQVSLDELLENSDFVTLHIPINEKTRGIIGKEQLELMKPSAFIINTSRGGLIDEDALYNALKEGKIAGAGLDVFWEKTPFESKIMELQDKLILTPHIGSSTTEAQDRIGELLVEKVKSLLQE